jgi:N-acetylmuramoyl-L-alanine amidase
VALSPWEKAVAARTEFEAASAAEHTRAGYTHVLDAFRAIYHDDPGDQHAADAVENVAELLAEQGRELGDAASLKSAVGQYRFLAEQYPQSRAAREAKARLAELAGVAVAAPAAAMVPEADSSAALRNGKQSTLSGKRVLAQVTGIRHWSTATYTRVAIDLGDEVTFEAARVPNPDRIYFDLHGAKLTPELAGKSFAVTDDGFLKRIRAAQAGADVTRVVLDVNDVSDYSAFLLPNPYRLIIDIHGGSRAQGSGIRAQEVPVVPSTPVAATDSAKASAAANASGLPAMAPTDGGLAVRPALVAASSTEGRTLAADSHVSEARPFDKLRAGYGAPSTVIAPKMVPGAVGVKAPAATAEVAAVSNEPGKVEATSAPTSKPIAAGVPVATSVNLGSGKRSKRVRPADGLVVSDALPAAPAKAAEKTADGETSMIRALGLKIGRIVIDAGHGGHDSGTLGADGIEEKDVVLDVALRLGKLLSERLGAQIVYTRSDDTFIPLETRTAIANKAQADLFISIHANSSQDATARGVETYYLNFTSDPSALDVAARENAVGAQSIHQLSDLVKKITLKDKIEESREFASDVEGSLYSGLAKGNEGLKNRGVKKAPFVVLIGANMPSILAEISFVTNPKDASQLRQPEYRQRVAESLYAGVSKYENGLAGVRTLPVQRASTR